MLFLNTFCINQNVKFLNRLNFERLEKVLVRQIEDREVKRFFDNKIQLNCMITQTQFNRSLNSVTKRMYKMCSKDFKGNFEIKDYIFDTKIDQIQIKFKIVRKKME